MRKITFLQHPLILSLLIVLIISWTVFAQATVTPEVTPTPPSLKLVFDIPSLLKKNPELFAKASEALLKTNRDKSDLNTVDLQTITLGNQQNLYKIIAQKYGFSKENTQTSSIAEVLASNIRLENGLSENQNLISGKIKLVPFFSNPQLSSLEHSQYSQFWNLDTKPDRLLVLTNKTINSDAIYADDTLAYATTNTPINKAPLGQTVLTQEQFNNFVNVLGSENLKALISTGAFDLTPLEVLQEIHTPEETVPIEHSALAENETENLQPETSETPSVNPISDLDSQIGTYYVIDFFKRKEDGHKCSHGDMVLEVARTNLQRYGLKDVNKIQPMEIDYYSNPKADEIIKEYLDNSHYTDDIKGEKKLSMDYVKGLKRPTEKYTSILYLQALYGYLLSKKQNATIISSSTYFLNPGVFKLLPESYNAETSIPVLNATLNDSGSSIADTKTEPLRSFYDARQTLGGILVGATQGKGFDGMSDRLGQLPAYRGGVTTIGPGNWDIKGCPDEKPFKIWGTSFATPAIGSILLVAKLFWKKQGKDYTAVEIRRRLILASQPQDNLLGWFSSGGIPQLDKLLITDKPILVGKDSKINETELDFNSSTITVSGTKYYLGKKPNPPQPELEHAPSRYISGFLVKDSSNTSCNAYIFNEGEELWRCGQIDAVSINVKNSAGETKTIDWSEFTNNYKEIIIP